MNNHIDRVSDSLKEAIREKINKKTKPIASLGRLEEIAEQVALIQNTLEPTISKPNIVIFAGDHGIAREGVSLFPQEVTGQMISNFLSGGAAINVFARQHNIKLTVVDAGVIQEKFDAASSKHRFIQAKIAPSTKSFLTEPAMTEDQCIEAMTQGANIVDEIAKSSCNTIAFGEMGIGNTASASAIMSRICGIPVEDCVGRGTGLDDLGLNKKREILSRAMTRHKDISNSPVNVLACFGGFETAMMTGAMLKAASLRMIILVDGFISTSAFLVAHSINQNVMDYAIFCHQSGEQGHQKMLSYLNAKPLLNIGMRLGEGTGACVALPIVQSAALFLCEMASFDSAGVSNSAEKAD